MLTGKGEKLSGSNIKAPVESEELTVKSFTLSEGRLIDGTDLRISKSFFNRTLNNPQCIFSDNAAHFIETDTLLSDGSWLVDIEGAKSIRELTILPGRKLHVAGGKVPFECLVDDIQTLGRVVGIYSEVS